MLLYKHADEYLTKNEGVRPIWNRDSETKSETNFT